MEKKVKRVCLEILDLPAKWELLDPKDKPVCQEVKVLPAKKELLDLKDKTVCLGIQVLQVNKVLKVKMVKKEQKVQKGVAVQMVRQN